MLITIVIKLMLTHRLSDNTQVKEIFKVKTDETSIDMNNALQIVGDVSSCHTSV